MFYCLIFSTFYFEMKVSPFFSPEPTYKSLPALDQWFDQVDSELKTLTDSLDVLYEQEDREIDFLENFLDYDCISIEVKENDEDNINALSDLDKVGACSKFHPMMKSEKSTKNKIRERLRWLTSRGKLSMRNFRAPNSLKNMNEGLQKSKERIHFEKKAQAELFFYSNF